MKTFFCLLLFVASQITFTMERTELRRAIAAKKLTFAEQKYLVKSPQELLPKDYWEKCDESECNKNFGCYCLRFLCTACAIAYIQTCICDGLDYCFVDPLNPPLQCNPGAGLLLSPFINLASSCVVSCCANKTKNRRNELVKKQYDEFQKKIVNEND